MSTADTKKQLALDAVTWIPVAFFSIIEAGDANDLCQLWVNPLGETKWEKVQTRNIREMTRVYKDCTVFGDDSDSGPDY